MSDLFCRSRDHDLEKRVHESKPNNERVFYKGYYSCDRDYCDVLIRLCEEKEGGMIED